MKLNIENLVKESIYKDALEIAESSLLWEKLQDKTVLITGGNGFIAYYLTLALLLRNDLYKNNVKILALVRNFENAEKKFGKILQRTDVEIIVQDVCEAFKVTTNADYIIHAASPASGWHFENDPIGTMNANLLGTENVLKYAKKCNAVTLFLSSLKVYGKVLGGKKELVEEEVGYVDHTLYSNCYAMGKRVAETLCASYHKQHGLSIKIARPSYIYGASSVKDDRVWAQFIANIVRREDILLKSNGAPYRSFCYVTDAVTAMLSILLSGVDMQPYNIAAKDSNITIRDFAKKATQVFPKRNMKLSFLHKKDEQKPKKEFVETPEILNSEKLLALGWRSIVSLDEGIRRSVNTLEEGL